MLVTEQTYEQRALAEPDRQWELHDGKLREKPGMSVGHNRTLYRLDAQLLPQLDATAHEVRLNTTRAQRGERTYYIPDLAIVPAELIATIPDRADVLEVYVPPLPLVVEVWSPSTGDYDVDSKLPEYQRRGDHEIWRIHPYERTLTTWRRQPDGSYTASVYRGGRVPLAALPGVTIDLEALFA